MTVPEIVTVQRYDGYDDSINEAERGIDNDIDDTNGLERRQDQWRETDRDSECRRRSCQR